MTTLLVPHTPVSAAAVRRRMTTELLSRGLPVEVVDDAALVLTELLGNAIRHGGPLQGGGVLAAWAVTEDVVRLEVSDGGDGDLPRSASSSGAKEWATHDAETGRGLTIVALLSSAWGSDRRALGRTSVWAELSLHADRSGEGPPGGPQADRRAKAFPLARQGTREDAGPAVEADARQEIRQQA